MFLKRIRAQRKNMAIFVCVAFVSLLLSYVTHAETSSSSTNSSTSQIAYTFSISNLIISNIVNSPTSPDQEDQTIYLRDTSGTLTSTKKPLKDRD